MCIRDSNKTEQCVEIKYVHFKGTPTNFVVLISVGFYRLLTKSMNGISALLVLCVVVCSTRQLNELD